jgi:DNA-binding transcriptional regulator YiaG
MPNLGTALKAEITRLAIKVVKQHLAPQQKASADHRRHIAALKREIAALKKLATSTAKATKTLPAKPAADGTSTKMRFQAKGLRTLRARLALSAGDFGKLAGVSGQTVYNWEQEKAEPRQAQLAGLAALRGIGKREALARLEAQSK